MNKSFYTYEEIKFLKQELEGVAVLSESLLGTEEMMKFKSVVSSYDAVLKNIGVNGQVVEGELVKEFNESRLLVDTIQEHFKM